MAGEAVNVITAVAPVGGDAIKVWFLRPHVSYRESVASVIVAKTTITLSQAIFLLIGVAGAVALAVDARLVRAMLWLLLVELIGVGGFLFVQVAGLVSRGARVLARFGKLEALAAAENLDRTLQSFYRREWRRFGLSVGFHLLGWLMGVLETWLFLHVLQIPASLATALVIETLGSAVRFATFFIPGSLGALEGANTAAFAALGFGAPAGLAFSLLADYDRSSGSGWACSCCSWRAVGCDWLPRRRRDHRRVRPRPRADGPADDRGFRSAPAAAARRCGSGRLRVCVD